MHVPASPSAALNTASARPRAGTGWVFDTAEAHKLRDAVGNAVMTYRQYRDSFNGIAARGMAQDLSWDHAAEQYEEVMVAAKFQW